LFRFRFCFFVAAGVAIVARPLPVVVAVETTFYFVKASYY
jgi:hypothetical protein